MKTIGLIGGMSWESSKVYYEMVNTMVKERLGGSHSAKSIMTSVDFAEIEHLSFEGDWDQIGDIVARHAINLEKAGADMTLLCTNTIHLVGHRITQSTTIPFIHIARATGEAIQAKGVKRVALLGTKFTMEKDFYTKILQEEYHLEVMLPSPEERQRIHDIIYHELVKGTFLDASRRVCIQIIQKLQSNGAEGVILGCTELPLLIAEEAVDIPSFNTTKIHAQKAVDLALSSSSNNDVPSKTRHPFG